MSFDFRFENILKIEKQFEKMADAVVQEKNARLREQLAVLDSLKTQLEDVEQDSMNSIQSNPTGIISAHDATERLRNAIEAQLPIVEQCRQELQEAIENRKQKSQRIEAFETIREEHHDVHRSAENRIEDANRLEQLMRRHSP